MSLPGTPKKLRLDHLGGACSAPSSPNRPASSSSPLRHGHYARSQQYDEGEGSTMLAASHALMEAGRSVSPRFTAERTTYLLEGEDGHTTLYGRQLSGWLWKRFGKGHATQWRRLWFYLTSDRLCYTAADIGDISHQPVRYIPLDRLSLRPLPHKQHQLGPLDRGHPDVGVAIVDNRVLTGLPSDGPKRTVFSLVAGSHTHYLAADLPREAKQWVSAIRETWLHCFQHTARESCEGLGATGVTTGVGTSQQLVAQNALLRESIRELNVQASARDSEYWKKWVEEKARNQVLQSQLQDTCTYEVLVTTSDIKGAGTDGRVYIEVYGMDETMGGAGEVRLLDLDSGIAPFQRNGADSFTVMCRNVGVPARIRVGHDNTGKSPDWHLAEIKVRKAGSPNGIHFPCNRWFSTSQEDGRICRELLPGAPLQLYRHQVLLVTSDLRGAGTDANVHIVLHGTKGDGRKHALVAQTGQMERGSEDVFEVLDADLGDLLAVTIGHDGSGPNPAWHLDRVEVQCIGPAPMVPLTPRLKAAAAGDQPLSARSNASSSRVSFLLGTAQTGGVTAAGGLAHGGSQFTTAGSTTATGTGALVAPAGKVTLFLCNAWLDERLGGGALTRRLPAAREMVGKVWYSIHVVTSDFKGAGTDADVHVALVGAAASTNRIDLPSKPEHFERGQRDTFRLQLPNLGLLQKLTIGHNNRGSNPDWHLAWVEVVEEANGKVTYFACDRWLGADVGDGLLEVTLKASTANPRDAYAHYQVTFFTSQIRGAGTAANITMELQGDRGSSGCLPLAPQRKDSFSRSAEDAYQLKLKWLGQLQRCRVGHDNSGENPAWHLERVEVVCSREPQVVTVFPCSRWVGNQNPSCPASVELTPGSAAWGAHRRYLLEVQTSSCKGAGTDAEVAVEVLGSNQALLGPWKLDRQGAFERAQLDTFEMEEQDIGVPVLLRLSVAPPLPRSPSLIRSSGGAAAVAAAGGLESPTPGGQRAAWHVQWLALHLLASDGSCQETKYFWADRWLGGAGHPTLLELPALDQLPHGAAGLKPYLLKVYTSNMKGAGTDANIDVVLVGERGESGWRRLLANKNTFERGQVDEFTQLLPDLGQLQQLIVRSDGSGSGSAWHLEKILIYPPAAQNPYGTAAAAPTNTYSSRGPTASTSSSSQQQQQQFQEQPVYFIAKRWLDEDAGLQVVLPALHNDPGHQLQAYHVKVYTSDIKGAGTDATVLLNIHGTSGSSGPQDLLHLLQTTAATDITPSTNSSSSGREQTTADDQLVSSLLQATALGSRGRRSSPVRSAAGSIGGGGGASRKATAFTRGQCDEFYLMLPPLGQLSSCEVWLEQEGDPWHLELITVTSAAGETWFFHYNDWLGSGRQRVQLTGSLRDPRAARREYQVVTHTSNLRGAGTDANVFVELIGESGISSGRLALSSPNPQTFEPGRVDAFQVVTSKDLGELVEVVVRHDGTSAGSSWHLQLLVVTEIVTKKTWWCECGAWMDAGTGDRQTVRRLKASAVNPLNQKVQYEVKVHTTDRGGAPTSANVHITLLGSGNTTFPSSRSTDSSSSSSSGRQYLRVSSARPAFEAGSIESFTFGPLTDLGELTKVIIGHDGTGTSPAWHLHHVTVANLHSGQLWTFPCYQWIGEPGSMGVQGKEGHAAAAAAEKELPVGLLTAAAGGEYEVAVYTGTEAAAGAGSDLVVTLVVIGRQGQAGPLTITQPPGAAAGRAGKELRFQAGQCDRFTMNASQELGELQQVKLLVSSTSPTSPSSWYCDTISITDKASGETTWFYCGQWMGGRRAKQTAAEEEGVHLVLLDAAQYDIRLSFVSYQVTAFSSRGEYPVGAQFKVRLLGASGSSKPLEISECDAHLRNQQYWQQHQQQQVLQSGHGLSPSCSCSVRCQDLGQLRHMEAWLEVDGTGPAAAWLLGYVKVQHMGSKQVWYFTKSSSGSTTLDPSLHPRSSPLLLSASASPPAVPTQNLARYRVTLVTGDKRGAGTDAPVYVIVGGSRGQTAKQVLQHPDRNCFEKKATDLFEFEAEDVSPMEYLTVGHNNGGLAAAWYLESATVEHLTTGQTLTFVVQKWFDRSYGDGLIERTLHKEQQEQQQEELGASSTTPSQSAVAWELVVVTGKVLGAGTDADVWLQLKSQSGSWGPSVLTAGREAFEAGRVDEFQLQTPALGELVEVVVGHDGTGRGAAWYLESLSLTNLATGEKYSFKADAWLDSRNKCHMSFPVSSSSSTTGAAAAAAAGPTGLGSSNSGHSYQIEVMTSDLEGAGTSAAVVVQLCGSTGNSQVLELGSTALLTAVPSAGPEQQPQQQQQQQKGIDARGHPRGRSRVGSGKFQRGSLHVFQFQGQPDLGSLDYLMVGLLLGAGHHNAWHLAWVRVTHLTTRQSALFHADCWIGLEPPGATKGRVNADNISWVKLTKQPPMLQPPTALAASPVADVSDHGLSMQIKETMNSSSSPHASPHRTLGATRPLVQPGYQVTFHTSNIWGAGTDAKVFFELTGQNGSSGVIQTTGQLGRFQRGHMDTFLYPRLPYLGTLMHMRVATDGTGMFAAWHLSKVEVVHVASGERTLFDCHDWVDAKCGWQRLLASALVLPGGMNLATMMTLANMATTAGPANSPTAAAAAMAARGVSPVPLTIASVPGGGAAGRTGGPAGLSVPFSGAVAGAAYAGDANRGVGFGDNGSMMAHGKGPVHGSDRGWGQQSAATSKAGSAGGVVTRQLGAVVGHSALIGADSELRGGKSMQHKYYNLQQQKQQQWRQQQL